MKRPRVTIGRLIVLIALIAVGLFVYREFDRGIPPRFVIRGIPGRIARLKPGMHPDEVDQILGLDRSWLSGGTNAVGGMGRGGGGHLYVTYGIGERRSRARIMIVYRDSTEGWLPAVEGEEPLSLVWAGFEIDDVTIAEMPRKRP